MTPDAPNPELDQAELCAMKHKGYADAFAVDLDAGVIRGRVVGTRDVITFQGQSVAEARAAFIDSVEDYLEFCREQGEEPEKPDSGKLLVRLPATLHRELANQAEEAGVSINAFVVDKLSHERIGS